MRIVARNIGYGEDVEGVFFSHCVYIDEPLLIVFNKRKLDIGRHLLGGVYGKVFGYRIGNGWAEYLGGDGGELRRLPWYSYKHVVPRYVPELMEKNLEGVALYRCDSRGNIWHILVTRLVDEDIIVRSVVGGYETPKHYLGRYGVRYKEIGEGVYVYWKGGV